MNPIVTSRSLARSIDGVYRDGSSSLVRAQLTRRLLHVDELSSSSENMYAFESGDISSYEHAARLYSETARKTTNQKTNTFVVIASLCVTSIPAMMRTLL
ncbi:hypothetical protein SAMN05444170_1991 [Bradyrhizobium erythrophlei]|uniref:Uncharacterized protein n=1 Tax=Bradyrhizobium erythrophlei TaxID=1437360 RepID=A0A1M7TKP9_9BRAD|nr:hypothetical protein SAMN05444170_1991 [Bradyrhizobium erythrophlei]